MKFETHKQEIVEVYNEIKYVVGYIWNDQIFKTKIEAAQARATYKIRMLCGANFYSMPLPVYDLVKTILKS